MNAFPVIELFPASTQPPSARDTALSTAMGLPAWTATTFTTALDIALCLAVDRLNGPATCAIGHAIETNAAYVHWRKVMPALSAVPAVRAYRNKKRKSWNLTAIDAEVLAHGNLLAAGQVLFHGGTWTGASPGAAGDTIKYPKVLSTSVDPVVAISHASKHGSTGLAGLWVLTVAPVAALHALALKTKRSQTHAHEREVLIQAGAVVTCTRWHPTSPFPVVECVIA